MPNVSYTDDGSLVANWDPSQGADGVAVCESSPSRASSPPPLASSVQQLTLPVDTTDNPGDMAWIMVASALVMVMAPGVCTFSR